jgi:hypothetical protein
MNNCLVRFLLLILVVFATSSCSKSVKKEKIQAIKAGVKFMKNSKINSIMTKGDYISFSEINDSISDITKVCRSNLVKNDSKIRSLMSMMIQEGMFNYPHLIRGDKTYELVNSAIKFPLLYPDISPIFKKLTDVTDREKELYTQLFNDFIGLSSYKEYNKEIDKLISSVSLTNDDLKNLTKLNEQDLDDTFNIATSLSCTQADTILGIYDYESLSRTAAYDMLNNVKGYSGVVKSKIFTSHDSNGCPVYKNSQGEILQKSTKLQQQDGC